MTTVSRVVVSLGLMFLVLFITSLVLLLLLPARLSATIFVNPSSCKIRCTCGGCAFGSTPQLSEVRIQDIGIAYEWPDQINLDSSDTIRVTIATNGAIPASISTVTVTGNYRIAGATPEEVGTPTVTNKGVNDISVADAFGPKYKAFATAQLLATSFDVKTFDLVEQPLDQESDSWLWSIKPNTTGLQVVGLALNFVWKPINGGQVIQHQVWQTQIPITVTQPFLDRGQLSVATLITGALASGGLITGIITQFTTFGLEQLGKKRDKEKGEIAQPKSEKENKTDENRQEDGRVGEAKVQEVKSPAQLQQKSQGLFVAIRSLLQRRSQTLSVGVRVLLIMIVLLIIGGSVLLYYVKVLRPAQLSAQATAVANTHATATAQALQGLTEQQFFTLIKSPPTLSDPLRDNSGGNAWAESSHCAFTGGSYHVTIAKPDYFAYCVARLANFTNLVYQVQLSINSGDEGCLLLHFRVNGKTPWFDAFCINGNGHFRFTSLPYGDLTSGFTPAIMKGANATNTVSLVAQKALYSMYVNNQFVSAVGGVSVTGIGTIGVCAIDDVNATNVTFSNAKVWELS